MTVTQIRRDVFASCHPHRKLLSFIHSSRHFVYLSFSLVKFAEVLLIKSREIDISTGSIICR